jgi:superfamily II DNA or RNA helicase
MLLSIKNSVVLAEGSEPEIDWLASKLTFNVTKNTEYVTVRLLREDGHFPVGLIYRVLLEAKSSGIHVETKNNTVVPAAPDFSALDRLLQPLRPDQVEVVRKMYKAKRGTVKAATGSGKGHIVVALAMCAPIRWGIFAPTSELIHDLRARFKTVAGVDVGVWTSDEQNVQRITIFSYDKLNADPPKQVREMMQRLDGIIVDESHTACTAERYPKLMAAKNAFYRFGLSATPFSRRDKMHIYSEAALGPKVAEISYRDVLAQNSVAEADIRMVIYPHYAPSEMRGRGYTNFYKQNIQNNDDRNKFIADLVDIAPKPCIVFSTYSMHGKILEKLISKRGWSTKFIYGEIPKAERLRLFDDMRSCKLEVAVGSKVMDTGIDVATIGSVIIADCGASAPKAIQKVGRGMRKAAGKSSFVVYDIHDTGFKKAGEDGRLRPYAFERQAMDRIAAYESEGYSVEYYTFENKELKKYE